MGEQMSQPQADETRRKRVEGSESKKQFHGGGDTSLTRDEEITRGALDESRSRESAEKEYRDWETRERQRIQEEEQRQQAQKEREDNFVECASCGGKKDPKDISLVSESGGATCTDCATTVDVK